MIWIDLGLLGITAYRMVAALKAAFTVAEKLALAFLFALGLKSLILFFLIRVGVRPFASIQIGAIFIGAYPDFIVDSTCNGVRS